MKEFSFWGREGGLEDNGWEEGREGWRIMVGGREGGLEDNGWGEEREGWRIMVVIPFCLSYECLFI